MTKRTCTHDGCDKPHRARGLCSTHYNRIHHPDRHITIITCAECGATHTTTRTDGRYCSHTCWAVAHRRTATARRAARPPKPPKPRADTRSALRRAIEDNNYPATIEALQARSTTTPAGCWEWDGARDRDGYPATTWATRGRNRYHYVHRLALEAALGQPLGDQPAHHMCANSGCVNPNHLQPVTHRENMAEMLARTYMVRRIKALELALATNNPDHELLQEVSVPST